MIKFDISASAMCDGYSRVFYHNPKALGCEVDRRAPYIKLVEPSTILGFNGCIVTPVGTIQTSKMQFNIVPLPKEEMEKAVDQLKEFNSSVEYSEEKLKLFEEKLFEENVFMLTLSLTSVGIKKEQILVQDKPI